MISENENEASETSIGVAAVAVALLLIFMVGQFFHEVLDQHHEYRMAKIKCSEPTNSNKEGE